MHIFDKVNKVVVTVQLQLEMLNII